MLFGFVSLDCIPFPALQNGLDRDEASWQLAQAERYSCHIDAQIAHLLPLLPIVHGKFLHAQLTLRHQVNLQAVTFCLTIAIVF